MIRGNRELIGNIKKGIDLDDRRFCELLSKIRDLLSEFFGRLPTLAEQALLKQIDGVLTPLPPAPSPSVSAPNSSGYAACGGTTRPPYNPAQQLFPPPQVRQARVDSDSTQEEQQGKDADAPSNYCCQQ